MSTFRFSRLNLFLIGLFLIFTTYFSISFYIYSHSDYTQGVLVFKEPFMLYNDGNASMTLHYYVDMKEYSLPVETSIKKANQAVTVRYCPKHPERGKIYNTIDFWFLNMLWLIAPVMLLAAALFSFMEITGRIVMKMKNRI